MVFAVLDGEGVGDASVDPLGDGSAPVDADASGAADGDGSGTQPARARIDASAATTTNRRTSDEGMGTP
ncbi:hypothetical protein GCM10009775_21940 [Microbacterium aoyamense]|uniref:Uncharacterized protein n=1 Tax=Microbacterium aoyamense TaxID=344166 RepID=A0ABP5B3M0_9MICO